MNPTPLLRQLIAHGKRIPLGFWIAGAFALVIQAGGFGAGFIYDRDLLAQGEFWRLLTGHLVHFGWPHFVADGGLFLILGAILGRQFRHLSLWALFILPVGISAALYYCDPGMTRYAGLSAVNLGLLVFIALHGWQRNFLDWFWPTILAIYVAEVVFESLHHGHGGGMIRFDDPAVHVATAAHIAGAVIGGLMFCASRNPARAGQSVRA